MITTAFRTLAGWPTPGATADSGPASRLPVLVAGAHFTTPAAVMADRIVARSGRDAIVVDVEMRGRLPQLTVAVGRTGAGAAFADSAYVPWLSLDGDTLWLVSAYTPHPDLPFYRFERAGLVAGDRLPWLHHQDRVLGERQAAIAFAGLVGAIV